MLDIDGETVELGDEDVLVQTESRGGLAVASDKGITVAIDTKLSQELIHEGYARDLVRLVNTMRKKAGLALDDRIELVYMTEEDLEAAIGRFSDFIREETLATKIEAGAVADSDFQENTTVDGKKVDLGIRKV